jgi:hypothetical protein
MRRGGRSIPWPDSELGEILLSDSIKDTTALTDTIGSVSFVRQTPEQLHLQIATSPQRTSPQLSLQASDSVANDRSKDTKKITSIDLNSRDLTKILKKQSRQSLDNICSRRFLSTLIIHVL